MKKILSFLLVLSFHFSLAQTDSTKISLKFKNKLIQKVLNEIESKTNYRFYYAESWLEKQKISGNYKNKLVRDVLTDIFKNTILNYYITKDNKIILTQNIVIYESLPDNFFNFDTIKQVKSTVVTPVFYNEDITLKTDTIEVIKLGKESKNIKKNKYRLSGYVISINDNKPVSNIVVSIKNKNINAITNKDGFYIIDIDPGENIIEVKSLAYEQVVRKVIIYNDETLNFMVKENAEQLDEVVVDAENNNENVEEAITGIAKIDIEEIKNIPLVLGERDILKVALTLPSVKTAGEGSAGYNVRGGKADQNLILLDDVVLYNPSHFFGIFSALNPFTTGDATLYTGTMPADYGGRLSSVFDIKTKKPNNQKFSGDVSIGPVTGNVSLEVPVLKGKSALLVGGRGTYSDWILKAIDNESLSNSKASFYDGVIKYSHNINDNNIIEATGYYSKDNFSISSDSLFSFSNRLMSLKWKGILNDKHQASLLLANSEYQFNIDYESTADRNFKLGYRVNETQAKLRLNYKLNYKHEFDYGISTKLYSVNPGDIFPKGQNSAIEPFEMPREKGLESAIFISDKYKINKKLLLNLGFRYSIYNSLGEGSQRVYAENSPRNSNTVIDTLNFKNNEVIKAYGGPEARLSARYFLTPTLSLKGSFNSTYQYIHTLSNTTTVSPTDTWKLSDYNIKPQRAAQFSLGVFKNSDDNMYEFSLEAYYKKSKNILDYKVGANLLLNENIETEVIQGKGKAYGVELLFKKNTGKLNGWLGYSYSRSFVKLDSDFNEEVVNAGEYFPANFDKPHDFSLVGNYKFTKRYSISANFVYQTGRPVTFPTGNYFFNGVEYVNYSSRNKFRIPNYYRLDVGFNIEGNHKIKKFAHSFWNISIYNVLGRNNPYSIFFVTENKDIKAYKSSIFSVPIPTITYNFRF